MAKYHYVDPYTEAWWKLRRGKPTASQFDRIITPSGQPSNQARKYIYELIAERLLDETMKKDQLESYWVERGNELEPRAIEAFQTQHSLVLQRVGFVTSNDERIGASPDCLVRAPRLTAAVEVKCPAPWTQIGYLLDGPGLTYRAQVQGQLLVGDEWEAVYFFAWHPQMPSVMVKTFRDKSYQNALAELLDRFCDELEQETERARKMGVYHIIQKELSHEEGTEKNGS